MKISIFTDASCVQGHCGYGFYIGCTKGKLMKAGNLRVKTDDTILAELHCLANALHTLKFCRFKPISRVWVFMDLMSAVERMNGEVRSFRKSEHRKVTEEIYFLMLDICIANEKPIRDVNTIFTFQHVRAHTGRRDILSKINNWCDVNARKYAKAASKKIDKKR